MSTRKRPATGRRRLLAILTTGAILGTSLAVAAPTAGAEPNSPVVPPRSTQQQAPEARAMAEAKRTGRPVEIAERLDEFNETLANPDGTFTRRSHVEPVRAKVDGAWRTPDATLRKAPDGGLTPIAPTFPITFSGGGTAPLATLTRDGQTMSVSWPAPLPTPTVSGNTALYPEVLPGVDLKVLAGVDGFAEHLVVKTREAAADPALAELRLLTRADGLTVAAAEDGGIKVKGKDGTTVFQAPAPTMWDTPEQPEAAKAPEAPGDPRVSKESESAKGSEAPASADAGAAEEGQQPQEPPALPVKSARLGVRVAPGEIRLTPDRELLTAPDAQFPLVIDPVFTGGSRQKWSFTTSSYPNSAFVSGSGWTSNNPTDEFRVGYSGDSRHQSFFTVDTSGLGGAQILSSTLHTVETHSWGCTASDAGYTDLWVVGGWDHDPTWNNPLPRINKVASDSFAGGNPNYCPNDLGHDFVSDGLKSAVQQMADWNAGALTLSLAAEAGKEGNTLSYKRFKNNPYLEITYNRTPVVNEYGAYEGSWLQGGAGNKPVPCVTDPAKAAVIGNNGFTLAARVSDPDGTNTNAYYRVWKEGWSWFHDQDEWVGNNSWSSRTWPASELQENTVYRWAVAARDGITQSGYLPGDPYCAFTVDKTAPTGLTVTATDGKRLDVAEVPARSPRTLKFTATDTNLAGFCWTLDQPISTSNTRCQNGNWVDAGGGSATVTVTPTGWPQSTLHVVAYDAAGNRSAYDGTGSGVTGDTVVIKTTPASYVRPPGSTTPWAATEARSDLSGDLTGDGYADFVAVSPEGTLRLYAGNGTGGYTDRTDIGTGYTGALITHRGDFTGATAATAGADGYEDYLIRLSTGLDAGKLFIYPGNGLGRPNASARVELKHPTRPNWSTTTQILAPGNIDGKPGNDLLTVEGGKLYLYSGRVLGDGRTPDHTAPFDLAGRKQLGSETWSDYTVLAPGDVNGDGTADLIGRRTSDGALFLFPGTGTAGAYTLGAKTTYGSALAGRPQVLSLGNLEGRVTDRTGWVDLNDDGVQTPNEVVAFRRFDPTAGQSGGDLIAATPADSGTTVSYTDDGTTTRTTTCPTGCLLFYPGSATGLDTLPRLIGVGAWAAYTVEGPSPLGNRLLRERTEHAADFNGDGRTDLALTGGPDWSCLPVATSRGDGTVSTSCNAPQGGNWGYWAHTANVRAVSGDYNGDGKSDIALTGGAGWTCLPVAVSKGDGNFDVSCYAPENGPEWSHWASDAGVQFLSGDFNGDGLTDLAMTGGTNWGCLPIAYAKGDGSFSVGCPGTGSSWTTWAHAPGVKVVTGDYNGDGRTDIALTGGPNLGCLPVALTRADGSLNVTCTAFSSGSWGSWAAEPGVQTMSGDFNGDGRTDLALTGGTTTTCLPLALSKGDGSFTATCGAPGLNWAGWSRASGVKAVAGDFNGDGRTDVALTGGPDPGCVPVAASNGDGSFTTTCNAVQGGYWGYWASVPDIKIRSGDLDGDGRTDLVLTGGAGWDCLPVATSKGDGNFTATCPDPGHDWGYWATAPGVQLL
ncbi:FG-GAP-like repeat-containing protein [Kitasatospora sp. NPDC101235]|uniref:FG-GAP-like repeat-containing protein n=1 Tax=Kitasatospora sp. NPDC101235 TaxID=3364101 RepID=UPI00380F2E55